MKQKCEVRKILKNKMIRILAEKYYTYIRTVFRPTNIPITHVSTYTESKTTENISFYTYFIIFIQKYNISKNILSKSYE